MLKIKDVEFSLIKSCSREKCHFHIKCDNLVRKEKRSKLLLF